MFYSPITVDRAPIIVDRTESASTFVCYARDVAPSFKVAGYCTDDYGLHAVLVPVVYRDRAGAGFFAAYAMQADLFDPISSREFIDESAVYPDAKAAAVAAHQLADDVATATRRIRPEPDAAGWEIIRNRSRAPWLRQRQAA
jgi:hypothetical protein